VLVDDGQTVVIGGVYEFTDRNSLSKVPFLGDIPILGNLFKTKGRTKDKAELLVFLTPKVMHVASAEPCRWPHDGRRDSSGFRRLPWHRGKRGA
jgi:type IV pilus assembly protein PilQ